MIKLLSLSLFSLVFFLSSPTDTRRLDLQTQGESPGTIQFIGSAGGDNVFTIDNWAFTKLENLNQPSEIIVEAVLDIRSISCSWEELNKNVKEKKDYFFMKKFPEANIAIQGAAKLEDGNYSCTAMLTLKGITKPVDLTFEMSNEAPYRIKAEGVIIRQDFKFKGKGPENEVPVMIEAVLK